MAENLPAPRTSQVIVPSNFKEVHPDLVELCASDVSRRLRKVVSKAFVVPFLVPFILYLWKGNLAVALSYGALLLVVLLACLAFSFALRTKRDELSHATWILKSVEPSKMDAEFSCFEDPIDDKLNYAAVISINSSVLEPYIITTNGKKKTNTCDERYNPYTRKLNVFFDPVSHEAVVAEDGYGTRYWLRPASTVVPGSLVSHDIRVEP